MVKVLSCVLLISFFCWGVFSGIVAIMDKVKPTDEALGYLVMGGIVFLIATAGITLSFFMGNKESPSG